MLIFSNIGQVLRVTPSRSSLEAKCCIRSFVFSDRLEGGQNQEDDYLECKSEE